MLSFKPFQTFNAIAQPPVRPTSCRLGNTQPESGRDEVRFGSARIRNIQNPIAFVHEIRNHLLGFTISSDYAQDFIEKFLARLKETHPDMDVSLLGQAIEELSRINKKVSGLSDYMDVARVSKTPCNLNTLVERVITQLKKESPESMTFRFEPSPLGESVPLDETRIDQVLVNLLKNAVDATEGKGVIDIGFDTKGQDDIRLFVQDNGPGIPDKAFPSLFRPGFTTKGEQGNGYGLYLSEQIMLAHGGELLVQSPPGQGSRFTLVLPKGTAAESA